MPSKFAFQFSVRFSVLTGRKSKYRLLVHRNLVALLLTKTCTLLMEITKEGAQSLRMKMQTVKLYLKEVTVILIRL